MSKFKTFDDIAVARPELAASYLQLLQAQPGRPLALFARRRVGKTHFLDNDLQPAATKANMLPIYADLWLHREAPLAAIIHALEEALDDVMVPKGRAGKNAKTQVKGLGVLGASVQFGDEPSRRPLPDAPGLRLDALVPRLATAAGKPILLMLDEVQALGDSEDGAKSMASLRAVFQKHKKELYGIFTGSSQEALTNMVVAAGSPMYQFAQLLDFPYLDETYLAMLAHHFTAVHPGKHLDMGEMAATFVHVGHKPALMKDIVKAMSAEGIVDFKFGLNAFIHDESRTLGWSSLWSSLDEVQQLVLVALVCNMAPMAKDSIQRMNDVRSGKATITLQKIRTALTKLRKAGILMRVADGYTLEDALFSDFIIDMKPFSAMPLDGGVSKIER